MDKPLLRGSIAFALASAVLAASQVAPLLAQTDPFPDNGVAFSCREWTAITPADGATLTRLPKALWVGGAGNITMIGADAPATASGVAWNAIGAGTLLPVRPREIKATGTTATSIVACVK